MLDAVKVNARRGGVYAAASGGASRSLTRWLIAVECACLLPLALFDGWSRRYNRQGIRIVEADFVSMAPLRFNGQAGDAHVRALNGAIQAYTKRALRRVLRGDFAGAARRTRELLEFVHRLEEASRSLFPMTRHLLESIGFAACNAVGYAQQSGGRTVRLSKCFLMFQLTGLWLSVGIDRKAQSCHALGAGIVENDVPYIPFEEVWEARCGGPQQAAHET